MKAIEHPKAFWESDNPVLLQDEFGFETDTGRKKLGDGITAWNDLGWYIQEEIFTTASGTDDYTADLILNRIKGYFKGLILSVEFTNKNTGASTFNFNSFGAKLIKKNASETLIAGDIKAGGIYDLFYDGTNFQIESGTGIVITTPTLKEVLTEGNDGGGLQIKNIADPTDAQDGATKKYADDLVTGLWDDRGNYDASGNTYPTSGGSGGGGAILKGDIWTISVAGTLGGNAVTAGDTVRALIDTPGQTAANWAIAENNIGYVPENSANKETGSTLTDSTTKYPSSHTVKAITDLLAPLASPALTGNPTAPTQSANNNSENLATTAYVDSKQISGSNLFLYTFAA